MRPATGQQRHLGELTEDEWMDLLNDFADLVVTRHRISGSIATDYSLYRALEDERERAQHMLSGRVRIG